MASIAEQIDYFRTLANQYAAQTLATIDSYRIIVATQIQVYSVWFAALIKQSYFATITRIANARDWFVSLITSGWLKQQALWLLDVFIRGFWKGYNAVISFANFMISLSRTMIRLIKYIPEILMEIANILSQMIKGYYNVVKTLLNLTFNLLQRIAVRCLNELILLITNFPAHLAKAWYLFSNALMTIKDFAVSALRHLGTFFVNNLLPVIRSLTSKIAEGLASMMGVISGFIAGIAEILMSGISKTIAITFGLSAAFVDLSFDILGFLYNKTLGAVLPTLPSMPLLVSALPFVKAGLTIGLVGLSCYAAYKGCKKLYPIANDRVINPLKQFYNDFTNKFKDIFNRKNNDNQRIEQPKTAAQLPRTFVASGNPIADLFSFAFYSAIDHALKDKEPAAVTPLRDVRKSKHHQKEVQKPAAPSNRKRKVVI